MSRGLDHVEVVPGPRCEPHAGCGVMRVYLVVLSMQEEVKRDEIVVMGWRLHVKDKAMDAVLDERPQEPAHQKERQEEVLMDGDGDV